MNWKGVGEKIGKDKIVTCQGVNTSVAWRLENRAYARVRGMHSFSFIRNSFVRGLGQVLNFYTMVIVCGNCTLQYTCYHYPSSCLMIAVIS